MGNGKINNPMIIYSFQVNGRENWTAVTSESAAEAIIVPCLQNEVLKRKIIKKNKKRNDCLHVFNTRAQPSVELKFIKSARPVWNLLSSSADVNFSSWARPCWHRCSVTRGPDPGWDFRAAAGRRRRRGTGPRPRPRRSTGSTAARLRVESQDNGSRSSASGLLHP